MQQALQGIENRQRLKQAEQDQKLNELKIEGIKNQIRIQRLTPWWVLLCLSGVMLTIGLWIGVNLPSAAVCPSESICSLFRGGKRTVTPMQRTSL